MINPRNGAVVLRSVDPVTPPTSGRTCNPYSIVTQNAFIANRSLAGNCRHSHLQDIKLCFEECYKPLFRLIQESVSLPLKLLIRDSRQEGVKDLEGYIMSLTNEYFSYFPYAIKGSGGDYESVLVVANSKAYDGDGGYCEQALSKKHYDDDAVCGTAKNTGDRAAMVAATVMIPDVMGRVLVRPAVEAG
ncbi:hypothetical protein BGZ91_001609 [Linnemannia elongata]|nr:hypothetical protein BGZ91_001609 [Linnemannia elongata]